jgi:protein-L-isoaspartate(D-aspartate) O-methyltransferase
MKPVCLWIAAIFPLLASGLTEERTLMIESQLRSRGIQSEAVLEAMGRIPREEFVPAEQRRHAYDDGPLPIGHGQTISQPYIVALMTELLEPSPTDKVLEIGTGSGYQAAILGKLVKEVYSMEIVEPLALRAAETLAGLGIDNVHVRAGDGYLGWPEAAPFDSIIVTCAPDHVPRPLIDQLREGGRLIIPVGERGGVQKLIRLTKSGGKVSQDEVLDVRFVPLTRPDERN